MSNETVHSLTGTVEKIEDGRIIVSDVSFAGEFAEGYTKAYREFIFKINGCHKIAVLNLEEGDIVELEAPFEALDHEKKFFRISKVNSAKKVQNQSYVMEEIKIYNQDLSKNPSLEIPDLSVEDILGKDHQHLENIDKNLIDDPYRKNFLKGMNIVAEVKQRPPKFAYNALKSTRVGATTNIIISSLVQDLRMVTLVPNNDVMKTVEDAYNKYVELTGDNSKTFRKIQSNKRVCLTVQDKIEKNVAMDELLYLLRGNCKKCGIDSVVYEKIVGVTKTNKTLDQRLPGKDSKIEKIQLHPTLPEGDKDHCQQKAIVDELFCLHKEGFKLAYDLTVITYEKAFALMESEGEIAEMLLEVIGNADVLLFDEFGQYLSKQEQGVTMWERKEMIDTTAEKKKKERKKKGKKRRKSPTPQITITDIHEKLTEVEEVMDCVKGFNYDIIRPTFNEFLSKTKDIIEEKRAFRRIRNPLISEKYGDRRFYEMSGGYLFTWDEISGIDDERLIKFLKNEYKIDWAKTENISKSDDGNTISITDDDNSLSLTLNDKKTNVKIRIEDSKVGEFSVRHENGKINIYSGGKSIPPDTSMTEVLKAFFQKNYSKFEDGITSENKVEFKYLISLMTVLLSEDVVFHYSENTTWLKNEKTKDHEKFKIQTLKLFPGDDVLVENINKLIGKKQKAIFTDATTPPFRFNRLEKDVMNVMFGDPLGTNKQLLVIQDNTLWKFDNTRWHKGGERSKTGYKGKVIDALIAIIERLGGNHIKIWAPNRDIAREFVVLLNKRKRNLACTPSHTSIDSRVIVDWMRSSGALGVESDRRLHIIVGNPDVPRQAYEYLAFMYPDYYDAIPEQVLTEIGKKHNTSLQKIHEIIGIFHIAENIGNVSYRKETPDIIETELISKISDQLRGFFVGAAGWQAGSRAKEPSATDQSVQYLLGWDNQAPLNMVQWGYDLQILGGRKTVMDMATTISPPIVTTGGVEDIVDWLTGVERDPSLLLSNDFSELPRAISYFLAYAGKSITSRYVWPNITPNLQVGYDSEDHRNGFFVALNRTLKSDSIQVTEPTPGEFRYNFGYSTGIDIPDPDMKLIRKVLLTTLRNKKKEVKVGDIEKSNKRDEEITEKSIKRVLRTIKEYKLLEGSLWDVKRYSVNTGKRKGRNHWKIVKKSRQTNGFAFKKR
jgi:hypothetical protein